MALEQEVEKMSEKKERMKTIIALCIVLIMFRSIYSVITVKAEGEPTIVLDISIGAGNGRVLVEDASSGADIAEVEGAGTIQTVIHEKASAITVNLVAYPAQGYVLSEWYYGLDEAKISDSLIVTALTLSPDNPHGEHQVTQLTDEYHFLIVVEFKPDYRMYIAGGIGAVVLVAIALYLRHRKVKATESISKHPPSQPAMQHL